MLLSYNYSDRSRFLKSLAKCGTHIRDNIYLTKRIFVYLYSISYYIIDRSVINQIKTFVFPISPPESIIQSAMI